jgi:hypothetical protein
MRILFSPESDPMLLDSLEGMNRTYERLKAFLAGAESTITALAEVNGSPAPADTFLRGLRVRKGDGSICLSLGEDGFLDLVGSVENLSPYVDHFSFDEDEEGAHHHPEYVYDQSGPLRGYISPDSLSLIVEVDSIRVADLKGES